ncbi:MAG TPA: hypothetical protein P5526_23390 [Anaerolineae bacterium]|nr:hypothetical protein [Anaerolineae bacterium]
MIKQLILVIGALLLLATACGPAAQRADDAQPLAADVPTQTAVSETQAQAGEAATTESSGPVISFSLAGGPNALCNELAIGPDGAYTLARPCQQFEKNGTLERNDLDSLRAWVEHLANFEIQFGDDSKGEEAVTGNLAFNGTGEIEADDGQKQMIFDWINGLILRLDPQEIAVPPTPELTTLDPAGLCPEITRPAILTVDFETPNVLTLVEPETQATCEVNLSRLPVGRIATSVGAIFYPVFDPENETVTVLRIGADGEQHLLPFTQLPAEEQSPTDFVISPDGSTIAWTQTIINTDVDPAQYTNSLWLAQIDGSNQMTVLDQVQNEETRFITPIRFSADGSQLFYALQPDVPGLAVSGRFDDLYSVPVAGGEPELVYVCPEEAQNAFCISGFALDGSVLAIIQPAEDTIQVVDQSETLINSIPLPATDYVERTAFSPNGNLAFVTATLSQASEEDPLYPDPGYLTVLAAPYSDSAQTLLSDSSVGTLWGWLDDNRLIYGTIDEEGETGTAIVTLEGQTTPLSSQVAVGVVR